MHQDPGERAVTPQETDPDLPGSVQESPVEAWVLVACCRAGGTECSSASWDLWKEVAIVFITSIIVMSQANNRGNTAPPINRKLG